MNSERTTSGMDGRFASDLLMLLRRRLGWVVLVAAATFFSTFVALQLLTEQYETAASVLVKIGRENAQVPPTVEKGGVFTTGVRKEEINSEIQLLSSPSLIARVVEQIGPEAFRYEPPPPTGFFASLKYYVKKAVRWGKEQGQGALIAVNLKKELGEREKAILGIQQSLIVEREKDSDVILLRLRLPDPQLAVRILDALLHLYRDEHIRLRREVEVGNIFEEQVRQRRARLEQVEAARQRLRGKYNISSIPDQRLLLLRHDQDLRTQMAALENERAVVLAQQREMQARLNNLTDNLQTAQVVTPNPSLQTIKERITTLQARRAELATRYAQSSQVLQNIDGEIASLQKVLRDEDATLVASKTSEANPVKQNFVQTIEQSAVKLAGIEASLQELGETARSVAQQLRILDGGEHELERIERERKIAEENYLIYAKRGEEAYIDEQLNRGRIANIAVLQTPSSSMEPVYPRKLMVLGLSLPVGLILGVGLALLQEYFGDRINTSGDLEALPGVPYLETIRIPSPEGAFENGGSRFRTFVHAQLERFR